DTSAGNTTVVACASGALDASKFFASRSRRKNGANLVDIDQLEIWINQTEPKYISKTSDDAEDLMKYCSVGPAYAGYIDMLAELEKSVAGKNISSKVKLCVEDAGTSKEASNITDGDCPYINPVYAICDTHPYNLHMPNVEIEKSENDSGFGNVAEKAQNKCISEGYGSNYFCNQIKWAVVNGDNYTVNLCNKGFQPVNASNGDFGCKKCETGVAECNDEMMLYNWNAAMQHDDKVQEIVRLKTTVLSQQLYKQYEYLNATLRRLKTQLEKAVLTSNLEAAGAKSEGSSSGLLGANNGGDKVIVLAGAENCWNTNSPESAYSCIQNNVNLIKSNASTNKQKAAKQLASTADVARQWEIIEEKSDSCSEYKDDKYSPDVKEITKCANALSIAVAKKISEDKRESQKYQYRPY
nr:hypothetical protein [Candidatus Enterousia merdequi]